MRFSDAQKAFILKQGSDGTRRPRTRRARPRDRRTRQSTRSPARLREARCDLVMDLSHLGFPQDCALAEAVDGIDVILSGHTHNRLTAPMTRNGALIIQSGCHGSFVGRLDLTVEGTMRCADWRR